MRKLRDLLQKSPWVGWGLAAVFLLMSVVLYMRLTKDHNAYSTERMSEIVTIKCIETGDEWEMTRGLMEQQLRRRGVQLNPEEGIVNPKTGRPTGFPFNKDEWRKTIERINREKAEAQVLRDSGGK